MEAAGVIEDDKHVMERIHNLVKIVIVHIIDTLLGVVWEGVMDSCGLGQGHHCGQKQDPDLHQKIFSFWVVFSV